MKHLALFNELLQQVLAVFDAQISGIRTGYDRLKNQANCAFYASVFFLFLKKVFDLNFFELTNIGFKKHTIN